MVGGVLTVSYCLLMDSTRLCRELNCRAAIRVTKARKKAPPQHAPLKNFFLGWARETQVHNSSTELLLLSSRGVVSERVSKRLPSGEGGLPSGGAPSNSPRHEVDHHGDQDDSAVDGSALKHFGQPVYVDEDGASLYAAGSVEARFTAPVSELDLVLQVLELLIHVEAQDDENDRAPGASAVAAPGEKFHPLHGGDGKRRGGRVSRERGGARRAAWPKTLTILLRPTGWGFVSGTWVGWSPPGAIFSFSSGTGGAESTASLFESTSKVSCGVGLNPPVAASVAFVAGSLIVTEVAIPANAHKPIVFWLIDTLNAMVKM